jgi:hypothetical protein
MEPFRRTLAGAVVPRAAFRYRTVVPKGRGSDAVRPAVRAAVIVARACLRSNGDIYRVRTRDTKYQTISTLKSATTVFATVKCRQSS